jgi:hypothetical protein
LRIKEIFIPLDIPSLHAPQAQARTLPYPPNVAWQEIRLQNADAIVQHLSRESAAAAVACRGQASATKRHLSSTFDRLLDPADSNPTAVLKEVSSLQMFQRRALNFLAAAERPLLDTMLGTMQLLRHYGGPTRLLDWSRSPWVAAYFACQAGKTADGHEADGAVWLFDLDELVRATPREWMEALRRVRRARDPMEWADLFAAPPPGIHLVYPDWENPRIIAQQGFFTLASGFRGSHDELLAELVGPERCRKLVIPAATKAALMHTLAGMNLTAAALFPGADGIGRTVEETLRLRLRMPMDNDLRMMFDERGVDPAIGTGES